MQRRTSSAGHLASAAFTVSALLVSGCAGDSYLDDAALLAYWSSSSSALRCDGTPPCFGVAADLGAFATEVANRRKMKMELVRFDAHRSDAGAAFAGVWAASEKNNLYSPELNTSTFRDEQQLHSTSFRPLVHLAVWQDGPGHKIATIWGPVPPAPPLASEWKPDRVGLDCRWATPEAADSDLLCIWEPWESGPPGAEYYLDQLEVYEHPITGSAALFAGVWRPGTLETTIVKGSCTIYPEPIDGSSDPDGGNCTVDDTPQPLQTLPSPCPVMGQVESLVKTSHYSPVDFEYYEEAGVPQMAVLLHKKPNRDWLMVPGTWGAVDCRHQKLEGPGLGLLDLDLMPLVASHQNKKKKEEGLHEGLVHDSGTSGPGG